MTRKQTMNAPKLLAAAEHYIFVLDLSAMYGNRLTVNTALQELRNAVACSREPLHVNEGIELPFPKTEKINHDGKHRMRELQHVTEH